MSAQGVEVAGSGDARIGKTAHTAADTVGAATAAGAVSAATAAKVSHTPKDANTVATVPPSNNTRRGDPTRLRARPALGISELGRKLDLTRSTTHRYVATLATLGYLQQDESTRKYRLGPRVLDLGFSMLGSLELREIAAPHLRRLTDLTGHTSNLAIRDDTDVILIDRVRGRPSRYHHLEFTLHVGSRLPSYCSATGKALLAFLPRPDLDQLLDRIDLVQRGPRTLTSKTALLAELDHVRRTGVAVNDEELESALRSIAVPVRSRSGQVIAAVNIAIPWSPEPITELVGRHTPALHDTARQIAARVI